MPAPLGAVQPGNLVVAPIGQVFIKFLVVVQFAMFHAGAERYAAPPRIPLPIAAIIRGGAAYRSAPA